MVRSFIGQDTALSLQRDEFDSRTNRHIRLGSLSGLSAGLKNQRMLVRHQSQAPHTA